jgi:hypothetical protein
MVCRQISFRSGCAASADRACCLGTLSLQALSYLRRAHFHPVDPPPAPAHNAKRLTQKDLAASYKAADRIKYSQPGISTG